MMKRLKVIFAILLIGFCIKGRAQIKYTEYDLPNGLHVILHKDNSAPVVAVSVMYHVGSKDEDPQRTGMAHFFEHLLFEGTQNMGRGDFMKIVSSNGGQNNANTSQDRTFYYEVFPSNQLELGLWLESERMLHPKIEPVGIKTQNEVVKEEKRLRIDNKPYGKFMENVFSHLFQGHPYRWQPIGSMAHLDAATLEEFTVFFKKNYVPNNAVLCIAGDLDVEKTRSLISKYFEDIPRGPKLQRPSYRLEPLVKTVVDTIYDGNIKIPAIFASYRVPGMRSRDSKVLNMISSILSNGGSSRLRKKMIDDKETALEVVTYNYTLEDHGLFIAYSIPNNNHPVNELLKDIDQEIVNLQRDLISDNEFEKLKNQAENAYVNANRKMIGIAESLANGYTFQNKNTNDLNEDILTIRAVTREEIRDVAKKYLQTNQRVVLYYLPKK